MQGLYFPALLVWKMLKDSFGRKIEYVRISLTDRCNLRCRYCMPESGIEKCRHDEILAFEEIKRVVKILKETGVKKFRFTGGEPFLRRGSLDFFESLDLKDFYITTSLSFRDLDIERISRLDPAGINVSLDSLKADRFKYITRCGDIDVFLGNLKRLKVRNLKINTVVIKDFNEDEIIDFINFGLKFNATVRFIEKMKIVNDSLQFVPLEKVKDSLIKKGIIDPLAWRENNSVAEYHKLRGQALLPSVPAVGFITPVTRPFCGNCNKFRIKATGNVKLCIFSGETYGLRDVLRRESDDEKIKTWIGDIIRNKPESGSDAGFPKVAESMSSIGG